MEFRIKVFWLSELPDGRASDLMDQIDRLNVGTCDQVRVSRLFFLRGDLSPDDLDYLVSELLVDPIVEGYHWRPLNTGLAR